MASATTRATGRPRKASTAASHPPGGANTPAVDAATPSASAAGPSTAAGGTFAAISMNSTGPTTQADCESYAAQLIDPALPIRKKLDIAVELRDSAESNRDHAFYEKYLAVFIPMLTSILGDEKHISFVKDSLDQRFRNALLNFLQRLPHNEPYRQHEKTVLELMVRLLRIENDENALVCIKVIIDGVRTHKEQAESVVEPFLEVVKEMYRNLKATVEKEFGTSAAQPASGDGSAPASAPDSAGPAEKRSPQTLSPALHSPKVLTECPIAVVLVFQTYKTAVTNTMLDFYPLALACIQIQPEPQRLAYEEYKAKGEVFVGVAQGIQNREMYADLLKAQVKTVAFLAYVLRSANLNVKDYIEVFPDACIRLLRDCPTEDFGTRKELLVATRHILSSDSRSAFVPFIDSMLDERIICGTGITSRDILRPLAYSIVADLIHHVRAELSIEQLSRVAYIFGCNIVDPSFNNSIQTMCAKLLNTIVETIYQKGEPAEWNKLMRSMFFSCLEKLAALSDATDRMRALALRDKGKGKAKDQDADGDVAMDNADASAEDKLVTGWRDIEMAMPVKFVAYAGEPYEVYARDARFLFKTVLYTFRTLLNYTRQVENPTPPPDGQQLALVFEHTIRGVALLDGVRDAREAKDIIELVTQLHLMFEPHVFNEVWSSHMDFFVQHCLQSQHVFPVIQFLIGHESVSHQLVSICLKFLMNKLPELGSYNKNHASLILRLFKMSFVAINNNIQTHEAILVPHLQKLILDAFKFAAQATDPAIYYQVLRALFRSIGGGRFEALYKEVLPILQEMLDTLAYLLNHAATDAERDLFVELTLTVPVRLTNLLPYLSYLMRPLVFALRAGPEQVSQGLRTLELCIDNLTADFLDPTMTPILADLMAALHRLLKPIPSDRKHANAAIKILGKLGGRTRRFIEVDLDLDYRSLSSEVSLPVTLEGKTHKLPLSAMIESASSAVTDDVASYREDGLQTLMIAVMAVLQEDGPTIEGNTVFTNAMSGLYLACARDSVKEKAITFVRDYCRRVLAAELNRTEQRPSGPAAVIMEVGHVGRKRHLPLTSAVSDCFVDTLASATTDDREKLGELLSMIIDDFREIASNPEFSEKFDTSRSVDRMIQTFCHRFAALCHEEDWRRKMAGVGAIRVLVDKINISRKLLLDLEVDMVRALLFCLRDSPKDPPSSATEVVDLLKQIIKTCQSEEDGSSRVPKLTETLVLELNSQSKLSRDAAHEAIELLAESLSQSLSELLAAPVKAKLFDVSTGPIFSKPLRALPFGHQVGIIDAVTYVMNIRPAILEPSDELVRFLHEVLALADVEDEQLLIKPITHKNEIWVRTLRIACLRLLRSAMNAPDFLNKPTLSTVRGRIIQVYFKHVYSSNTEIVDVAHEGLRDCLEQQAKLPKEILQTGLRPILVNLADAKRLSVSGLDGLARFLELLTTYFKVEIGVKLLEHFNSLGEPATLAKAAYSPLEDNPEIMRMTRLINIFRLLPSTAVMYLNNLVTSVVDAEAHLHQYTPGPFTVNLAKYLDKFYFEGAQNLIDNIRNPRYIWTFRNVIASGEAPQLVEELSNRADVICTTCFSNPEAVEFVLPGLYLVLELSRTSPSWLTDRVDVIEALVNVWRTITTKSRTPKGDMSAYHYQQMPPILLEMFMATLKDKPNVHLLFHLVEAYEIRSSFEKSQVAFFLYQQVALNDSVEYRKEVIDAYFNLYENDEVTWAFKANALRLIVNPTLKVYFDDPKNDGSLVTSQLTMRICSLMWKPLSNPSIARMRDDDMLVEIYHLTSILVGECVSQMTDVRKEVFKFAWMGINILEPTVKLIAYIVTAKFMVNFETPIKFVRLTWVGLLRLKDTENFRTLYREAIDALATAVTKRDAAAPLKDPAAGAIAPGGPPHLGIPDWAARVRTILVEEGHANNVVMTVCELLVNHPDMFYDYRELYVPYIANSIGKLGFAQAAGAEHKKLTIDAVELIYKWEKRRMAARDEARESDAMDVDETGSGSKRIRGTRDGSEASPLKRQRLDRAGTVGSSSSGGGWAAPTQVKELMTAHLLRLISTSNEPVQKGGLTKRALDLFKEILGPNGLPAVYVKLTFFTRTMNAEINEQSINAIANSTEVIAAVAASKDQAWIRQNLALLTNLLDKVFVCEDASLHDIITPLTEKLFLELPESEEADASEEAINWYKFVSNSVHEGLVSSQRSSSHLPGTLFLLRHWLKVQPRQLQSEAISSGLMRVLGNLVKVHTSSGPEQAHRLIIAILDIVRDRVNDIREQRRNLHTILLNLIERSPNLALCRYLLDLLRDWVLKDPEITSQGKEKAALLRAMLVFRNRDETLFQRYLDLVYDIYQIDELRSTDLTHRLEVAFLYGTRSKDVAQRQKFMNKLEQSMPTSLDGRLQYLYSLQNWENLADSYWIPQILGLLLGLIDYNNPIIRKNIIGVMEADPVLDLAKRMTAEDVLVPARNLIHLSPDFAHKLWVAVFPMCWSSLSRSQQASFTPYIATLLSKEYHRKQVESRRNVIHTFLAGILACSPVVTLPPLLVKYLCKTFNAWYVGFEVLTKLGEIYKGDDNLRDNCNTALSELYAELCEEDMFYGLARSRCVYQETTAALTCEQNGQYPRAMELYEQAQSKARAGALPFSEEEYCFWEDHWILCAQKLQHWDSLTELARTDQDADLLLECAWRLSDWGSPDRDTIEANLQRLSDVPTPRRKTFEAFTALLRAHSAREPPNDFLRILDEAQQISLRKWVSLPAHTTAAHLPLLQMFQQCVELNDASTIFDSLQQTTAQNLEARVNGEVKSLFQTWRDRLPNFWDDIAVWSDMLAWRQHVFQAVTKVYVPLIDPTETATYGFRGYHETAWTINRFGEVARRHGLLDVCSLSLNKIYQLPNIEISEAFLKLREQALCYFQKVDKFNEGLDNISTTNLAYFSPAQKAEFLTLKGMFIAKLGQNENANAEFAHAIQMDMSLPRAWAEWGRFNDRIYGSRPEMAQGPPPEPEPGQPRMTAEEFQAHYTKDRSVFASSAVSCYLTAAGLYMNHKSRGLLLRVLWLIAHDDQFNTITKAFENYRGEMAIWYWITLAPQLIISLSRREAKQARLILLCIAKQHPQAVFYQLRVSKEDNSAVRRQTMAQRAQAARKAQEQAKATAAAAAAATAGTATTPAPAANGETPAANGTANGSANGDAKDTKDAATVKTEAPPSAAPTPAEVKDENAPTPASAAPPTAAPTPAPSQSQPPAQPAAGAQVQAPGQSANPQARQPWELVEEVMNVLKTSFPLLTLTMEKMVDQISLRAKPASDEDIYRFFAALLSDALQQYGARSLNPNDDGELIQTTKDNLVKFSSNLAGDLKLAIEQDFMRDTPKLREYIRRLQSWRDNYERALDARPRMQPLDQGGCNLIEFHHTKFDDIEVPGQYVHHIDSGDELVKIARFAPKAELARGHGHCFRRITMIGSNGSLHTFNVQLPAARHCRREERLTQLFRIMNSVLKKRKESRRRNLQFHLPTAVPLAPQLRLVENDASYISLQDIYDDYCLSKGQSREDSIMSFYDRLKQLYDPTFVKNDPRLTNLKCEVLEEIQAKMVPENIMTNYMIKTMSSSESLWLMRKQFAVQTAAVNFLTYVCCLNNRAPNRFHLSRKTGLMYMTEILPAFGAGQPLIQTNEAVPFRLTPNMQHFITRVGIEGVVTAATTAIARSLTRPEFELGPTLQLFIKEELTTWYGTYMKDNKSDAHINQTVPINVDNFVRRANTMGYLGDQPDVDKTGQTAPSGVILHAVVTLISQATSPTSLAQMNEVFMSWY